MKPEDTQDYSKPVAYDNQGRPLYAHPPVAAPQQPSVRQEPQQVYITRPLDPRPVDLSPEIKQKVEESRRLYPGLNLSDGEYVISAVKRHPIGLIQIWLFVIAMILVFGVVIGMWLVGSGGSSFTSLGGEGNRESIGLAVMIVVTVLGVTGGMVASYVYNQNRFFLTNESVIQLIQTTIFSLHEQTVSLSNIEDASYEQHGILPHILNYGRIRLSTEGDETTYRFSYVANPKQHIATLNNAVEAFKNGRPIHH